MSQSPSLTPSQLGSRALFPSLRPQAYLAHAAISPLSAPVTAAIGGHLQAMEEGGALAFGAALEARQHLRESLATLISAAPDDIGFVQNTGAGLSAMATALVLRPGERVALFRGEYPSNVAVFQQVAQRAGATVQFMDADSFLQDEQAALAELERELQRGLRLVALSFVQFQTGLRMPLAAIGTLCRTYGALLSVDAVQGLGAVPLDVQACQIDMLACGAHKWLMGMDGLGFVYVRPQVMAQLQPLCVGAMSYHDGFAMLLGDEGQLRYDRRLLPSARVFEGGMISCAGVAALQASLSSIQEIGVDAIYEHIQRYHDLLEPALVACGFTSMRSRVPSQRSGTLALKPPAGVHAGQLVSALQAEGIVCSSPAGLVRLAPHWPNALSEVPVVITAVERALKQLHSC